MIRKRSIFMMLALLCTSVADFAQEGCPLIPLPEKCRTGSEKLVITKNTAIITDDDRLMPVAIYLRQQLLKTTGISVSSQQAAEGAAIRLVLNKNVASVAEGYSMKTGKEGVLISAPHPSGVFYGVVSLLQLAARADGPGGELTLPQLTVEDKPALAWRGLMLDESRHFFGAEKVKSLLDWMAFYKLNRFHWHLTDEPGWRAEIKKYPRLALIGGIGNFTDPGYPARYYTQEEIKEVVAYAAARFITVIPEIDMPGHATAANTAYPRFSGGGSDDHPDFTFHPGKEETYRYLTDILREVNVLFPSGMVHLGGDEVSFGNRKWATDTAVVSLMKRHRLDGLPAVERYFMKRMADSLDAIGSKFLAWDEMADLPAADKGTIIFWWRHDKPAQLSTALANGNQVVVCPRLPFYFDFVQDSSHTYGRKWGGKFNRLEDVYAFDAKALQPDVRYKDRILGVQANLWTETVQTGMRLDYLVFPRLAALAEAAWTTADRRSYTGFLTRLKPHLLLYRQAGIYYYDPFTPASTPEPGPVGIKKNRFKTED